MQKSLAVALILLVVASTFCIYLYDKWTQAEEKYRLLRVEYLNLLEERGECVEEQRSLVEEQKSLAEKLENCTATLNKMIEKNRETERER